MTLDLQIATDESALPSQQQVADWATAALTAAAYDRCDGEAEISVRIVDETEMVQLNGQYRDKHNPTNVLSFPTDFPCDTEIPLLGDLVVCARVVEHEARQQNKELNAHWAHMIVHGTLHLIGYDHINDQEADNMEQLETDILCNLGFPPPYNS